MIEQVRQATGLKRRLKFRILEAGANRIYILLLLGLLIGTFGATSLTRPTNGVSYACFVLLLGTLIARTFFQHRIKEFAAFNFRLYDAIPLGLLLIWLYGFARGLYFGNDNVYRNFAGMTLYSLYYVFLLEKINRFQILRCVLLAAGINAAYMLAFFFWDKLFSPHFYSHDGFAYLDVRSYYSETLMLVAMPVVLMLYKLFSFRSGSATGASRKRGMWAIAVVLYIYAFAYLQASLSKATVVFYWLAIFVVAASFSKDLLNMSRAAAARLLAALGIVFCIGVYPTMVTMSAYMPERVLEKVTALGKYLPDFEALKYLQVNNPADAGTPQGSRRKGQADALEMRQVQTDEILKDIEFLGKGLGATLKGGYARDVGGYGFEANYLNLAHKFGVFVLFIYFVYAFIAFRIATGLQRLRSRYFSLASAALFTGIVMGFGNPVLMSPVMVTLQCIALYWLRDSGGLRWERRPSGQNQLSAHV